VVHTKCGEDLQDVVAVAMLRSQFEIRGLARIGLLVCGRLCRGVRVRLCC